ncbi:MAG: response regulator [bacterium]|nr:response regulator [bacterium]
MPKNITVLVVEDEEIISQALKSKLEKIKEFNVKLAMDGEAGFEAAKSEKPDVILLDLIMPKMSGFDVLNKLKDDPDTKNIPVVILSNLDDSAYIKKAQDGGALDYLVKTRTNLEEIIDKVKASVKK